MSVFLEVLSRIASLARPALFLATLLAAALCLISWATRTRRLSPFSRLGQFSRSRIDPLLAPVEGAVLRAGGSPSTVPWWSLAAFVVIGILVQSLVGYITSTLAVSALEFSTGPRGSIRAVARLIFEVLQVALLIRVVMSWLGGLHRVRWLRWAHTLTEPLLAPLRAVLPAIGPFDLSPLVLYYLLRFVGGFVLSLL